MLHPVLSFLTEQLNIYIQEVKNPNDGIETPYVILQNISRLDEEALKNTNNVILTLVNVSEEATMKNNGSYINRQGDYTEYKNPPVNLNLYVLFSACMVNYEYAMIYLSHIITFFQGKNTFSRTNSDTEVDGLPDDLYIILDLFSLSFEQSNYIWSTLGGKQHPFALYKVRLLTMERKSTSETRGVIKQIKLEGLDKT